MKFTEEDCLIASVLLSLDSFLPDQETGSGPPLAWGCRKRRSAESLPRLVRARLALAGAQEKDNAPLPARAAEPTGVSSPPPVIPYPAGIASKKSSPKTPLEYSPTSTDSSCPKEQPPRLDKRKAPVKKSGNNKLKTMEELRSTLDDSIRTNELLKTEIKKKYQLRDELLKVNFLLKDRGRELNSRISTQSEHCSNVDPEIIPRQLPGLDRDHHHHQPPLMVPNTNTICRPLSIKEAAALARQTRMLICRRKKRRHQLPR